MANKKNIAAPEFRASKGITDAPELRGTGDQSCSNCNYFKSMPAPEGVYEQTGLCSKFDFMTFGHMVCNDWEAWEPEVVKMSTVKAVSEWELDVLAIPFGVRDSDGQYFDENTDIKHEAFSTPLVVYQHGVKQGAKGLSDKPVVIGLSKAGSLEKKADGWHLRVVLDKTIELAKSVMEGVKKGLVAVSSGSIDHLARLDINGKSVLYDKHTPGRISVWPFAEISLWERGNGNFNPASRFALALPAMKAIYEEAGMPFPVIEEDEVKELEAAKSAKFKRNLQRKARALISTYKGE